MNTKLIVTAMVLLVAAPILLGYAMSFEEVEKSAWKTDGDPTLISDLLMNDVAYSYTTLDTYNANTSFYYSGNVTADRNVLPFFQSYDVVGYRGIDSASSFDETRSYFINANTEADVAPFSIGNGITWVLHTATFDISDGRTVSFYSNGAWSSRNATQLSCHTETENNSYLVTFFGYDGSEYFTVDNVTKIKFDAYTRFVSKMTVNIAGGAGSGVYQEQMPSIADGWTVVSNTAWGRAGNNTNYAVLTVDFADLSGTFVYSVDLVSGSTAADLTIVRTEASGDVPGSMTVNGQYIYTNLNGDGSLSEDSNVYQILIDMTGYTVNYIASFPTMGSQAYSYSSVSVPFGVGSSEYTAINLAPGPVYRMDLATVRSNGYSVMNNVSYKIGTVSGSINNEITLTNVQQIGDSITVAGQIFPVAGKTVLIDGKNIPLKDLTIRSYFENGVYHNSIGGHNLSNTNQAPTITFGGRWYMGVQETKLTYSEWTSNEWVAGEWAWDGVGSEFGVVGLLGCVAVFIGLGMYGARSGAKVGTLMLICGAAALIFIALI